MVNMINKKSNIFGDDIAFVEQWNFSRANMSEENRINAITQVASICYQSSKSLNSESLYNRLLAESQGLPSSSFEFVPVLIHISLFNNKVYLNNTPLEKYGTWLDQEEQVFLNKDKQRKTWLLTNFRSVIETKEIYKIDLTNHFNTEEECKIIKKHFKVFLYKVDFPTRSQMVRHRVNWQELSRRYVSGKRVPFDFYVSEKMGKVRWPKTLRFSGDFGCQYKEEIDMTTQRIIEDCIEHYYQSLKQGIKPQEARRIIPQAAYTQIWGAFQPTQYANFMKLRDDSHAQWEIAQVAKAMRELVQGETV